jgi:acetyltransferase-like isoleucine patch superfamily enzyme
LNILKNIIRVIGKYSPHNKLRIPIYRFLGLKIGQNVFIGPGCTFYNPSSIVIEDGVSIAPKVSIIKNPKSNRDSPCIIKSGAFIGAGTTIYHGITVGECSIIGAGSIVEDDIPPRSVAVGAPAKVIKHIPDDFQKF